MGKLNSRLQQVLMRCPPSLEPSPNARRTVQKDLEHRIDHARHISHTEGLTDEAIGQHGVHTLDESAKGGSCRGGDEGVVQEGGEGEGGEAVGGLIPRGELREVILGGDSISIYNQCQRR
jgi:hypothetical protein